jgi:hypothetical protein
MHLEVRKQNRCCVVVLLVRLMVVAAAAVLPCPALRPTCHAQVV